MPGYAEPGQGAQPAGQGQGAEDRRGGDAEEQGERAIGHEEDSEEQGQDDSSGEVQDRRCYRNEAHGRDRSTGTTDEPR